jgi:riboflavin kinase
VIKGFGRGSKELGIPTANIPPDGLSQYPDLQTGVYYGVVALDPAKFTYDEEKSTAQTVSNTDAENVISTKTATLPAVLSIGYNPFYKNTVRSVEIHIMPPLSSPSPTDLDASSTATKPGSVIFHKLPDFYSTHLNLLILGYIRPEYDYISLDALVEDIRVDCEVARTSLARKGYTGYLEDGEDVPDPVKEQRNWLRTF